MSITLVKRDKRWVFAGDKIRLEATLSVGNRFRIWLYDKPIDSALQVSDPDDPTYLPNNEFTPDVAGSYTVKVIEESVTFGVPHFSNDLGYESATLVTGKEVVEVKDSYYYSFTVAQRVRRDIGAQPDTATLELVGACDDWVQNPATWPIASHVNGVVSRFIDTTNMPKLTSPSSDRARVAMGVSTVVRAVADIGGQGNNLVWYGQRAAIETSPIIPWDDIADSELIANLWWTFTRYNDHIFGNAIDLHGLADVTNVLTEPACDLTEPTQRALLNEILSMLAAHAANTGAAYHHDADSVTTVACAALVPLPVGSTLAQRIARATELFDILDGHLTRVYLTSGVLTSYAHATIADNHMAYATLYPAYDATTVRDCANAMRTAYTAHLAKTNLVAANYHATPDSHNTFTETTPTNVENYIKAVGKLLTLLQGHVSNTNTTTGATVGYHTGADWTSRVDQLGTPTDYTSAVIAHEAIDWALAQHAARGTGTHAIAHAGHVAMRPFGVEAIHHAYRTAMLAATPTIPANENYAAAKLILVGGFTT
jgi:hypothetical protein